jgi:hypothetical protein
MQTATNQKVAVAHVVRGRHLDVDHAWSPDQVNAALQAVLTELQAIRT